MDAGLVGETPLDDPEGLRGQRGGPLVDDFTDPGEEVVVGAHQVAAHHDDLGVEQVHRGGERLAQATARREGDQLARFLESGWLHLTCVDSVDAESWYAYWKHPGDRAWRHEQYQSYLVNEVLPFTHSRSGHPFAILAGASFGAFHALSIGLRHPDKFHRVLSMSGLTDIKGFLGGYHDQTVYFQNPVDFIPNEHDGWRLEVMDMDGRRIDKVMAVKIAASTAES